MSLTLHSKTTQAATKVTNRQATQPQSLCSINGAWPIHHGALLVNGETQIRIGDILYTILDGTVHTNLPVLVDLKPWGLKVGRLDKIRIAGLSKKSHTYHVATPINSTVDPMVALTHGVTSLTLGYSKASAEMRKEVAKDFVREVHAKADLQIDNLGRLCFVPVPLDHDEVPFEGEFWDTDVLFSKETLEEGDDIQQLFIQNVTRANYLGKVLVSGDNLHLIDLFINRRF